jgi:hypothetical protein
MPSEAKNKKAIVFGEKYHEISNEEATTAEVLLMPYQLYKSLENQKREIQSRKRKKERISDKEAFIPWAIFHILNGMKLVADKEDLNLKVEADVKAAHHKTIDIIEEVVKQEKKNRGNLYSHDWLFKQTVTNSKIREQIIKNYLH